MHLHIRSSLLPLTHDIYVRGRRAGKGSCEPTGSYVYDTITCCITFKQNLEKFACVDVGIFSSYAILTYFEWGTSNFVHLTDLWPPGS